MNVTLRPFIIIALFTGSLCGSVFAQKTIKYSYDDAGNRTERVIKLSASEAQAKSTVDQKEEKFEDKLGTHRIVIYPNPTKGQLLVEVQGYEEQTQCTLAVYSISGTLLFSKPTTESKTPLDLSTYPMGTYILHIKIGDTVRKWKIIKQ